MAESDSHTRRRYLKGIGATGVATVATVSGCISNLGGGGGGISGPIPMGSILPLSGSLQQYGSGMQEATQIAVEDINNGGGPGGAEIELHTTDSQTSPSAAQQRYNSLVSEEDIVGFVGAASSGVSTTIAQNVASDEVMEVSNASTSPVLTNIGYKDVDGEELKFFGRTAPSDGQQGRVMGEYVMGQDSYIGADSVAFLYVGNAYGEGLANKAANTFQGEVLNQVSYAQDTSDYTPVLDRVHEGDPDAIGFIGYPENGQTILTQWSRQDYGTSADQWVLSEGLNSEQFLTENSDMVSGMWLTTPDPAGGTDSLETFQDKIGEANTLFAPHAYDAMFLQGLAMHKAGEASGPAIARNIRSVSRPGGEKVYVGEFERAKDLLDDGSEIDYVGASSPVNLTGALQPLNPFAILRVNDDGSKETIQRLSRSTFTEG